MSTVDFVVVVTLILSVLLSVLRGFTREVLTLVSLGGAVAAVVFGMPVIHQVFAHLFASETTGDIAGGAIVGIVTLVILSLIGHQIGKVVNKSGLGPVDRVLGSVFGVARALLLLCILYIGLKAFVGDPMPPWIADAKATPYVARVSDKVVAMLPQNIQDAIKPEKDKDKAKKGEHDDADDIIPEKPSDVKEGPDGAAPPPPEKPGEAPAAATKDARDDGYGKTERKDLDKLIDKEKAKSSDQ